LEVRIMSLLKTSKPSTRRNTLLLMVAGLLLTAPCAVAAAFAPEFDLNNPETWVTRQQDQYQEAAQKLERARAELQHQERELAEQARKNPNSQGEDLEKLHRMEAELQEASARLSHEQDAQVMKETEKGLQQARERLAQAMANQPADEARMREAREKLEQLQRSLPENDQRTREVREQLAQIEKQYMNDARMAQHSQDLLRTQEKIAQQEERLTQEQREKIEEKLTLKERQSEEIEKKYREALEKREVEDRKGKYKIKDKDYEKLIRKDADEQIRKEVEEAYRAEGAREQAELTRLATISMDRAIQIAMSQNPGKVLSCSLGRQKDGQPFYRLVIINGEGDKSSVMHVWVSATDGRILKTEHD
jgi:hypothetical protein